jgi:hypothetical protein
MRKMNLGLNKKAIIGTTLGILIAQQVPTIATKLGLPASGITGNVVTAVVAIVLGKVFKKPEIMTVGLSFAIADALNTQVVSSLVNSALGTTSTLGANTRYPRLGAYTSKPSYARNRIVGQGGFYQNQYA